MAEIDFDPKKVAIATISLYPKWYSGRLKSIKHTDKVRGDLALEFAQRATALGYHLIIGDGKSTKTFRNALAAISGVTLIKRRSGGSGEGKRASIEKATKIPGVEAIVLTELEKVSVLTNCMKQMVVPVLHDKADIVIPKRDEALFKTTFPRYMYESEIEGNNIFNETLRINHLLPENLYDMDSFFGPRVFKNDKKVVALFTKKYHFSGVSILEKLYTPDRYSNVQYFPIINGVRKGFRVVSVTVPFRYPHLQKENEEVGKREEFIAKRKLQKVSILIDLMHYLSVIKK